MPKTLPTIEQFVIGTNGKKQSVIIDLKWYQRLLEAYEDLEDLRVTVQRRGEQTMALETVEKELRKKKIL